MLFAASGPEALDRLAGEIQPILAAVLSDINMPGMDRLQLLGEIKRRRPDLPVMMVTAYGDDERRRRARDLGAFEFITKPLDFDQLKGRNPAGSVEPCLYRAAKLSSAHRLRAARRRCSTRSHGRCRPEGNVARRRDRRIRRRADHGAVERDRGEDLQCCRVRHVDDRQRVFSGSAHSRLALLIEARFLVVADDHHLGERRVRSETANTIAATITPHPSLDACIASSPNSSGPYRFCRNADPIRDARQGFRIDPVHRAQLECKRTGVFRGNGIAGVVERAVSKSAGPLTGDGYWLVDIIRLVEPGRPAGSRPRIPVF